MRYLIPMLFLCYSSLCVAQGWHDPYLRAPRYTYDKDVYHRDQNQCLLDSVLMYSFNGSDSTFRSKIVNTFDAQNRLRTQSDTYSNGSLSRSSTIAYDATGRVDLWRSLEGSNLDSFFYVYGGQTSRIDTIYIRRGTVQQHYVTVKEVFTYYPSGLLQKKEAFTIPTSATSGYPKEVFTYTPSGKVKTHTVVSIHGPNIFDEQTTTYGYDALDSLVTQVNIADGDTTIQSQITYYPDSVIIAYTFQQAVRYAKRFYANGILVKETDEYLSSGLDIVKDLQYSPLCRCPRTVTISSEQQPGVLVPNTRHHSFYGSLDCLLDTDTPPTPPPVAAAFVYPNPATTHVYLRSEAQQSAVYGLDGRLLKSTVTPHTDLDVQELPAGMYLVKVVVRGEMVVERFVKE